MELLESVGPRPRQARYQAALRPDSACIWIIRQLLECLVFIGEGLLLMPSRSNR